MNGYIQSGKSKKVNQLHFENVSFIFTKVSPDISYKAQLTSMIESMTYLDMIDKNFQKEFSIVKINKQQFLVMG